MAANNGQRKSSSFLSVFRLFKKKGKGGCYDSYESYDRLTKPWPSDEDRGHFGPAEPGIDMKAGGCTIFRKRISESEFIKLDPAAADATAEEEE